MRDLCDRVYVLHLDRIERMVMAERLVAVTAVAAGAKGVDVPTLTEAVAEFEASLIAEPARIDPKRRELLTALGVGRV